MKFSKLLVAFLFATTTAIFAQDKITLEEIWSGNFVQQRLQSLQSLNNGSEYVVLNYDQANGTTSIDAYSYKTGKQTRTILNSANLEAIKNFQDFSFSKDEKKILLSTEVEPIYRHSSRDIFLCVRYRI